MPKNKTKCRLPVSFLLFLSVCLSLILGRIVQAHTSVQEYKFGETCISVSHQGFIAAVLNFGNDLEPAAVDTTPPTVVSTSPLNGATDVEIDSVITATFSERMDASTINSDTFVVSDGVSNIAGTVSYNIGQKKATFTPSGNLSYSTTYTATITTGVKDLAGNAMAENYTWSFATGATPDTQDTTPPTVVSTIPVNGATDVGIDSVITATFSERMNAFTISTDTFMVSDGVSNIAGTVSYNRGQQEATFTPSDNLSYSTTYTATITTGVKDLAGNAMAANYTWSFATGATPADTTPPTVVSTSPLNGATGVEIDSVITATFSERMDEATITTDTFAVSNGSTSISGTVSYNIGQKKATFTPSGNLSNSTTYTAMIITGVKDLAGNAMAANYTWSFTTAAPQDTTTPTVISTTPENGASSVEIDSVITATFSERMDEATITTAVFTVGVGGNNISGTVSYNIGQKRATFTPSGNLSNSTTYTAMITTGAKDLAGNAMNTDYHWSFTTVSAPDNTPPTVSSTTPANGATDVTINSAVTATFSETMDIATITTATFTISNGGGSIVGTVSYSGTTATFTPSANLSFSTTYTAMITTGARDLAGNAMASNFTWSFATGSVPGHEEPPPETLFTINSTSPSNGATDVAVNTLVYAIFPCT